MNRKTCLLALFASLALAAPALAEAQPAAATVKVKIGQVCKADLQSMCAGTAGKGPERARCLRANQAKLSPDCAKAVAAKPAQWGAPAAGAASATPAPAAAPAPEKK